MPKKKKSDDEEIIVFEFMQSRSDAARKGWETRWEKEMIREPDPWSHVGPRGLDYLERKYGPVIDYDDYGQYDDFGDFWDFEFDY